MPRHRGTVRGSVSRERDQILARFVAAFERGIRVEMTAMQARLRAFEVAVTGGRALVEDSDGERFRYSFELAAPNEKLGSGVECTLRVGPGEWLATVEDVDDACVTLTTSRPVELAQRPGVLVIYPWFLYERLLTALADLSAPDACIERALALFGKGEVQRADTQLARDHGALDASQRAAVQLCSDSSLAFVWGPPGTGKTTTLAHIADELFAQGLRILLVSTTNDALDHALARLAAKPEFRHAIDAGRVVRLGQTRRDTFGAAVDEVVSRVHAAHREAIDELRERLRDSVERVQRGEMLLTELAALQAPQLTMFAEPAPRAKPSDLAALFPVAGKVARLAPAELAARVPARLGRYQRRAELCKQRIAELQRALRDERAGVVTRADCVLATLTNAYLSPLMQGVRFDVVIAEEASMAVLPSLFHAACLATQKTLMVGDPRQLPPIVQSDAPLVQQVMGRNIFDVTVPEPESSPLVAMLETQYRMHPAIGDLVSELSYGGRLLHADNTAERTAIAELAPFAGDSLVVVDTCGGTLCHSPPGTSSRANSSAAELCAQLAMEAVRAGAATVGVITPYALQAREIHRHFASWRDARNIECSTIHRFQGRERDVVVVDMVDAAPMRPGVLLSKRGPTSSARNLLNVSLSRARGKLILVADVDYFENNAPHSVVTEVLRCAIRRGRHIRHAMAAAGDTETCPGPAGRR